MKVKIISPLFLKINIIQILYFTFILFKFNKNCFFFKLPQNTKFFKKVNKYIFFTKTLSLHSLLSIKALFLKISFFKKNNNTFTKKIFLQGLGFKVSSIVQNKFIELKIGYSHNVKINIPTKSNLTLYLNKNLIIIEGIQKYQVGNFANRIKFFRIPDSYKGKGIWYKKEIKFLKEIKKT